MTGGIIIAHRSFGRGIMDAALCISGDIEGLSCLSNEGLSTAELTERIRDTIEESAADDIILFVDLFGGSCWRAAMTAARNVSHVVAGVNLPMIISFVHKRDKHGVDELSKILETDAKRGVRVD